jgi:hypothetical protein
VFIRAGVEMQVQELAAGIESRLFYVAARQSVQVPLIAADDLRNLREWAEMGSKVQGNFLPVDHSVTPFTPTSRESGSGIA